MCKVVHLSFLKDGPWAKKRLRTTNVKRIALLVSLTPLLLYASYCSNAQGAERRMYASFN